MQASVGLNTGHFGWNCRQMFLLYLYTIILNRYSVIGILYIYIYIYIYTRQLKNIIKQ